MTLYDSYDGKSQRPSTKKHNLNTYNAGTKTRPARKPTVDKHEKPIWSPAQLLNILSAAPTGLRAFFDCVALTGTRLGEVLALKRKHVDLERRILRIEHSLWQGQLLSPKTTASTRDILLGSALNETLRNHRENSLHRGPDDFVFCKKDGSALDPDVLRKDPSTQFWTG
jgi:integrase